jgi:hypothetical protein
LIDQERHLDNVLDPDPCNAAAISDGGLDAGDSAAAEAPSPQINQLGVV